MKKVLSIALALMMALSLLTACGNGTSSIPASTATSTAASTPDSTAQESSQFPREETFYFFSGMGVLPTSFNPLLGNGTEWPSGQMQYLLYEALFMMDMLSGELKPLIADSYEVLEDNSVKIVINEKAHFNDGTPLTAEDVKFSYDLGDKYDLQFSSYWDVLESVEVVDEHTVVLHQKANSVNTPVALDSMQMVPILPVSVWGPIVDEAGDDVSVVRAFDNLDNPVGSGPYKVYGFNDQGIYLERDDNYWGVERFGKLPAPKYIVQPIYKSNDLVSADLQNNKLDLAQAYMPSIWEMIEKNDKVGTYLSDAPYHLEGGMVAMVFNTSLPGLDDPEVRRAIAYGINYQQVAQLAVSGYSKDIVPLLALTDGVEDKYIDKDALADLMWSYDPDKCNELLDALGAEKGADGIRVLPDGTRMSWTLQTGYGWSDWNAAAEVISQNLKAVGVEIISDMPESAVFISNRQTGDFQLCLHIIGENPRPSQPWFRYKAAQNSVGTPDFGTLAFSNFGRYSNAEYDALIEALPGINSDAELTEMHTEINRIFLEEAPLVPIMYRPFQFYEFNESYWTGFPTADNGSEVPPMLDRGAGIQFLYEIEPAGK